MKAFSTFRAILKCLIVVLHLAQRRRHYNAISGLAGPGGTAPGPPTQAEEGSCFFGKKFNRSPH